jgi:hypothetical protein
VATSAVVAVVALGAVVGLIAALEATALVRLGPLHLSVGALISAPALLIFGLLAVWGLGARDAALLPAVGWFVALALLVFGPHPGGDILIPGSGWDVGAYLTAGLIGAALAALLAGRVLSSRDSPASPGAPPYR